MAKAALQNSIFPIQKKVHYGNVPRVTFTDPEVAHVGLSQPKPRTGAERRSRTPEKTWIGSSRRGKPGGS